MFGPLFYNFPHQAVGFETEEWESLPRTDRNTIRSYYLNGRDETRTVIFEGFETEYQVQKCRKEYKLAERPEINFQWADFYLY